MNKPVMLYDGDCGFCRRWIEKWNKITRDLIVYAPYQTKLVDYPQLTEAGCRAAVQLILPDGSVLSGAGAVFKALDIGGKKFGWKAYGHMPFFKSVAEWGYRRVANNRVFFSKLLP